VISESEDEHGFRLLLAIATGVAEPGHEIDLEEWFCAPAKSYTQRQTNRGENIARVLAAKGELEANASAELATRALQTVGRDEVRSPTLSPALIEAYAADVGLTIADLWRSSQPEAGGPWHLEGDLFARFFDLHNSEQLDALGEELGVVVSEAKTRAAKIQLFTSRDRVLKLPRSLAPAKTRAKKGAK
jgi:hypothetical protein